MPKLSFRDCKYKRKNSFRQNFPGKIPDSAAKGMLRAIRPSNAAPHGGRAAAKTDTATASGPAIFRPEMPRPGPAPKFAPKRPNNPVPGRRNHSADRPGAPASFQAVSAQYPGNELHPLTTGRRGPLPLFQTTVSANAIGPEHPVLPPVRTRLPGNGAVRLAGPASVREQNPPENADLPARPKGPFRTGSAPTPKAPSKNRHPRPQGRRCREFIRESGSRRNRDRISGP